MDSKNMSKKNSVTKQKPLPEINAASDTNKNQVSLQYLLQSRN